VTLQQFVDALNGESSSILFIQDMLNLCHLAVSASFHHLSKTKGTAGASGDLTPLAHLTLGLMGEGKMWSPTNLDWDTAANVGYCSSLVSSLHPGLLLL